MSSSVEKYYDFDDFIYVIRSDGRKSKRYNHWCCVCKKDRGYAYKNKILGGSKCHACKMQDPDTLAKISLASTGRIHSAETCDAISRGLHKTHQSSPEKTRIKKNIRARLRRAIRGNPESNSACANLGCTIAEFREYIESLFTEGMTWENHGTYGWHLDHIRPLVSFNLMEREELLEACHHTNLQPLWAKDNLSKGTKWKI